MNTARLAVGGCVVLVLIMIASLGDAGAATPFTSRASGSYVSPGTEIDTNDDGKKADLVLLSGDLVTSGQGKGSLGAATMQAVVEWEANAAPAACGFQIGFVQGVFVIRVANGDMLYGSYNTGTNCYDPEGNYATVTQSGTFTGGTGRFRGVTGGSLTVQATVVPLVGDEEFLEFPNGKFGNQFGVVDARFTGVLP